MAKVKSKTLIIIKNPDDNYSLRIRPMLEYYVMAVYIL